MNLFYHHICIPVSSIMCFDMHKLCKKKIIFTIFFKENFQSKSQNRKIKIMASNTTEHKKNIELKKLKYHGTKKGRFKKHHRISEG